MWKYICAASEHSGPESGAGIETPELSFRLHPPVAGSINVGDGIAC